MKPIIEVQNISKQYRIGNRARYLSLRDSVGEFFKKKTKNTADTEGVKSNHFWALDDVSFTVEAGESVGIIGRNGAGKSTLLKILSRITPPTKGEIILRGRVASLLEVGTGFHPELSGRENVYMNGSILGLRKAEIDRQFDEIVDFSGVEKFIDTPLKHFSSGMQLRLAFAVAAHLEPEILIIDEVLAVGDAEFQKKCLGKMDAVSKSGRTVLFVSHNLAMVRQLCQRCLLLEKGQIVMNNETELVLKSHLDSAISKIYTSNEKSRLSEIFLNQLRLIDEIGQERSSFLWTDDVVVEVNLVVKKIIDNCKLSLILSDNLNRRICNIENDVNELVSGTGEHTFKYIIPKKLLLPMSYQWEMTLHIPNVAVIESQKNICPFNIIDSGSPFALYGENVDNGSVLLPYKLLKDY